jgi:ubiquinone/menaquinone biosynthesis C-methylase UbiE
MAVAVWRARLSLVRQLSRPTYFPPYKRPCYNMGDLTLNPTLAGIWSPVYSASVVSSYIHEQFTSGAATYADRYAGRDHFHYLLTKAFEIADVDPGQVTAVLDVGSGAGNSIFPLLTLCPTARVFATDLSLDLLRILRDALVPDRATNVILLQLNAERLEFEPESFDLVVGASVLHHLRRPAETVKGAYRILKPGGRAIFFEPFAGGHQSLRKAYEKILADPRGLDLSNDARDFLDRMILDISTRGELTPTSPLLDVLDDKWLFEPEFFEDTAARCGFANCLAYPLYDTSTQLESITRSYFFEATGKPVDEFVPDWAWTTIRRYEGPKPANGGVILQR